MMIPIGSFDHWFSSMFQLVAMIAPVSLKTLEDNIDQTFQFYEKEPIDRALYLWHPHGMLSLTPIIHTIRRQLGKVVCVPIFHKFPIVRDLYHYVGSIPSEYSSMKRTLERESVSVIPGGIREMMLPTSNIMKLIIKDRVGVFKLALETGTPIVPVLTYGESDVFPQLDNTIFRTINRWVYDATKFAIPLLSITSIANWIQLAYSPLPPIRSFAGKPLGVAKTPEPSMEQIRELRDKYVRHLRRLFRDTAPQGLTLEVE